MLFVNPTARKKYMVNLIIKYKNIAIEYSEDN